MRFSPAATLRARRARAAAVLTAALAIVLLAAPGLATDDGAGAAPAGPGAAAAASAPARSVRVAFLGDSLTAGFGLSRDEAYPAVLARRLAKEGRPIAIVNAGVSGDTSAGGLRRLAWVLRSEPDVLVVALGANDGLRGLPIEQLDLNLRAIVNQAKSAGVRVVLGGMLLPRSFGPEYAGAFNSVYAQIAKDLDVPLVPFLLAGVGGVAELNQPDGIHPTAAGQEKVADNVQPHLLRVLDDLAAAAPAPAGGVQ